MKPLIVTVLLLLPFADCLDTSKCVGSLLNFLSTKIPFLDLGQPIYDCENELSTSSQIAQCIGNCQCSSSNPTICQIEKQPCLLQCGFSNGNLPPSCQEMFYNAFWDILTVVFPAEGPIKFLSILQMLADAVGDSVLCVLSQNVQPPSNPTTNPINNATTNPVNNATTCANPNAAQICQTQGCCNYDCDNLPSGFTQSGTLGVTCPNNSTQRCCMGINGCGYYCNSPVPPLQGADCVCVATACESAIRNASSATDCGGNCYAQCIANALGGICTGTSDAANGAPIIVFSPQCNGQPQGSCSISFSQPEVDQCQISSTPTIVNSPPSPTGNPTLMSCGGATFDISSCTNLGPTCSGPVGEDLSQCPTPCQNLSPCSQMAPCNDGTQCWLYSG